MDYAERNQMMRKKKNILSLGLAVLMAVSVTACGGAKKDENSDAAKAVADSKNYVYKEEELKNGSKNAVNEISSMMFANDRIYDYGYHYSTDGTTAVFFVENYKTDGSDYKSFSVKNKTNVTYSSVCIGTDGSIYAVKTTYASGDYPVAPAANEGTESAAEGVSDTEESAADGASGMDQATQADSSAVAGTSETSEASGTEASDGSSADASAAQDQTVLVKMNADGKVQWEAKMGAGAEAGSYYVSCMAYSEKDSLVVSDSLGISIYSTKDGKEEKNFADTKEANAMGIYCIRDGRLILMTYGDKGPEFKQLDLQTGKASDKLQMPDNMYNYGTYFAGTDYDLYMSSSDGVYAVNVGDTKVTKLIDFVDSDIDTSYVGAICALNTTQFAAVISDSANNYSLEVLTKVDPKDVKDKKVISLGCTYVDYRVRQQVVAFNRNSSEYRIKILDYSQYNSEDDYNAGLTKLNTDIITGNTPDLMILDSSMPSESYISKGVLKDLDGYFKKDEDLSRNKYLTNVMDAFKSNGKMYMVIPSFSVYTVAAKTADVGNQTGWTIADVEALAKKKNVEYANLFGPLSSTQDQIMSLALGLSSEDYINWDTQQCHYNSDGFISMLDFIKKFPAKDQTDQNTDTSGYWRDGKALLESTNIYSFEAYNQMKKGDFGTDITLIGFPTASKNGSAIMPDFKLVMSATSKYQDGCWQFMRIFLGNDYQNALTDTFPVSETALNALGAKAMKVPTYTDQDGKVVEDPQTCYIGGQEVKISPMTQDEVNTLTGFIKGLTVPYSLNQEVQNIITEETAPFLQGQKQAKDVADIIQSKVQIYVNENS
jgi:hypothetical protein